MSETVLACPKCSTAWPFEAAHGVHGKCAGPRCGIWLVAFSPRMLNRVRKESILLRPYKVTSDRTATLFADAVYVECPFCGRVHRHGWNEEADFTGPAYRVAHCESFSVPSWGSITPRGTRNSYEINVIDGAPVATPV